MSTGDFQGKQFAEREVAAKVLEQYDIAHARVFYRYVMGGGGLDIHYGVFRCAEDGVYAASKETNSRLLTALDWMAPIGGGSAVLDLGSGHGGLSHALLQRFEGTRVLGANISPAQNEMNVSEARVLGVGGRMEVQQLDFNNGLPAEWAQRFSHVISCEVLCHAASKPALLGELHRALKPGGGLAFTDIMGADGADEKALKDFTDRNATTKMARPSEYRQILKAAGFVDVSFVDLSTHLLLYFENMVSQIHEHRAEMEAEGVPAGYLEAWLTSLTQRVDIQRSHAVFAWGIFMCRKPGPLF
ncbi:S-adenosyl-L-methionine-dependent methyltransferase [Pavlovales sp. CCMP2436]|nr:S-adenosyl-L-methionine-dependent methyltransferase [Pavlovales sp. CCMP2436]|mmetsp:Transcript_17720/g.45314  ORF Transcript_17720/g.45314 Transcript_17720/m.45314 type:complete len:301 (+) Transcript_17720:72-974(+)